MWGALMAGDFFLFFWGMGSGEFARSLSARITFTICASDTMERYHKSAVPKHPKKEIGGVGMRRHTKEFREQALKLSDDIGLKKAAEQLGVLYGTLADWRKHRSRKAKEPEPPMSEEEWQAENERLKKENAELKVANEILKDALGFFVKDRKK